MIPVAFDHVAPTSVDEALQALAQAASEGKDVKVLGGGQSLIPVLRLRMAAPELLVDLSKVDGLRGVRDDGDALVIGAMTTHDQVAKDASIKEHALLLSKAAETVADPQVRHRGTFGGALVHADPAGDLPAPALALGAEMVIAGQGGSRRTVPAAEFFQDLFTTAVGEDELLIEVRIPKHTGWGAHYEKFARISHAWAIVGVAAAVRVEGGSIAEARVALTNMGSVPVRASAVEQALVGRAGHRRGGQGRVRRRGRGHLAAQRRQRRRRLPAAPRRRPHRSRRPGGRGRLDGSMELHHEFVVPIGIEEAWEAFNDLERIGPAFPGAAVTGVDGDDFTGTAKVKLGPISLQYTGTGTFASRDATGKRAVIEASGKDKRGNGTAGATITASLQEEGTGTRVLLDTDLKITGRPAQFGRGVIQDVGSKILDQFAANLTTLLSPAETPADVEAAPVDPSPVEETPAEVADASAAPCRLAASPPPSLLLHRRPRAAPGAAGDELGGAGARPSRPSSTWGRWWVRRCCSATG